MADEELSEVDAPVEDETDRVLAALTLVIAEAINSQGERTDDSSPLVVAWLPVLQTSAELVLLQYLLATTLAFTRAAGPRGAAVAPRIREIATSAAKNATNKAVEVLEANASELAALPAGERAAQVRVDAGKAARAMVVGAREETRFGVASSMGAVYKVWRTRRDTRVRSTHGDLEGNRVPLSNKFVTFEGNELLHPHDPAAPLSETAGCRCRLSYLVPTKEAA